jgi:hypothetical protein
MVSQYLDQDRAAKQHRLVKTGQPEHDSQKKIKTIPPANRISNQTKLDRNMILLTMSGLLEQNIFINVHTI